MAPPSSTSPTPDPNSIKIALAIALLRLKKLHHKLPSPSSTSDAQRWKQKAKERKREILRLREELKQLEDAKEGEDLPQIAACQCHFFDGCGDLRKDRENGGDEHWINEVLRRRFLRLVRWKERRRRVEGSLHRRHFLEFNSESEFEQLGTSIELLVELSSINSVKEEFGASFSTLSHQATDFILASLKNLLSLQKDGELIEETVNGLVMRLMRRMCGLQENNGYLKSDSDAQFYAQHLIRKLGHEAFVGQRVMLIVSQKVSIVADSLLVMDPFDKACPAMHGSMYMMIQLMELLILDSVQEWTSNEDFDKSISLPCCPFTLEFLKNG
ncbi:protein MULTIPOLAR SPINDLE 1 isoform X2 [Asparagus officinalis]|uniref:protein MULTIPOLAR SPINDLE 1 isoform X2 n=1 Tax=Asparagus officinalis TaxID=4686 RepID=UPI00098DF68C|nr:protein MULTIPOLAR SPINDLE 1 isoform X2 [Asparagus officinalis]